MFKITRGNATRTLLSVLAAGALLTTGCTANQQDALYHKVVELGRDAAGFEVKNLLTTDVNMTYMERAGSGPVVLMVHGFSANKDTWLKLAMELPADYRLIAPDLAGHGQTPAPDNNSYDLVDQAERLHALMQKLGVSRFHIAGNSMGGAISAIYATQYPDEIQSLILIDSAGVDAPQPSEFIQGLAQGNNPLIATDEESFETRWNLVMHKPPMLPWPLRPALVRDTVARADINKEIFDDMLATRERLLNINFEQQLQDKVHMPAMILWGEQDQVLDVSMVDVFKEKLPQAEVKILKDIGHVPMMESPVETATVMSQFIAGVE